MKIIIKVSLLFLIFHYSLQAGCKHSRLKDPEDIPLSPLTPLSPISPQTPLGTPPLRPGSVSNFKPQKSQTFERPNHTEFKTQKEWLNAIKLLRLFKEQQPSPEFKKSILSHLPPETKKAWKNRLN